MENKTCTKCGEEKPASEYYRHTKSRDGLQWECKPCSKRRANHHKAVSFYGITAAEYDEIIGRGCEICGSTERPSLDHDHKTGKVRGCLCSKCNTALGLLDDSIGRLENAIKYLRQR